MLEMAWARWVIVAVVAAGIVALLAWARNDPGIDDRIPDPEDAAVVIVLADNVDAGG